VRASTLRVVGERGEEPSESARILLPLPRLVFPTQAPFFGYHERSVYVAFRKIYLPAFLEIFRQGFEHPAKNPFLDPLLEAAVAGLVGRVAFRKVLPRGLPYAVSRGCRSRRREDLARAYLVDLLFEVDPG
jgi:hypothetical protein